MEITFQEDEDTIFTRLNLKNVEVHVISFAEPNVKLWTSAGRSFRMLSSGWRKEIYTLSVARTVRGHLSADEMSDSARGPRTQLIAST